MPTKAELTDYAASVGVDVDGSSMTKADIEAALSDAGYDPTNIGEPTVTEEIPTDPESVEGTSSDAKYSTYAEVAPEAEDAGRQVEQTRGEPTEEAPA